MCTRTFAESDPLPTTTLQVPVKNRTIASKMPPRFAKKQGSLSLEQQSEEVLSASNLGTEIWETNSSGRNSPCDDSASHILPHFTLPPPGGAVSCG